MKSKPSKKRDKSAPKTSIADDWAFVEDLLASPLAPTPILSGPPGAGRTNGTGSRYDGCSPVGDPKPIPLDIDATIPGDETQVVQYADGCLPGGSAELWTVNGGQHSPTFSADYKTLVIEWLLAHSRSGPGCPADLDGDNQVGITDFLQLLATWGPCA